MDIKRGFIISDPQYVFRNREVWHEFIESLPKDKNILEFEFKGLNILVCDTELTRQHFYLRNQNTDNILGMVSINTGLVCVFNNTQLLEYLSDRDYQYISNFTTITIKKPGFRGSVSAKYDDRGNVFMEFSGTSKYVFSVR